MTLNRIQNKSKCRCFWIAFNRPITVMDVIWCVWQCHVMPGIVPTPDKLLLIVLPME